MSTNWTLRLDLDVERDLPRSWWAEGEDDCLPDGLSEDEQWSLIRRAGISHARAIALYCECHPACISAAQPPTERPTRRRIAAIEDASMTQIGPTPEPDALPTNVSETAHPESVLLRAREVAVRLALSESRVYELIGGGQLPSVTIGRSRRVPLTALASFIADLQD
jgi:excisionase family DNA binding protein